MSTAKPITPTDAELDVLHILWQHGTGTVPFVHQRLTTSVRQVGYTTTLKTMQLMHEKGILQRNDRRRAHIYQPAIMREDLQRTLLQAFIRKVYQGDVRTIYRHMQHLYPSE